MTTFSGWFVSFVSAALLVCNATPAFGASGLQFKLTPRVIHPGERATLEIRIPNDSIDPNFLQEENFVVRDDLLSQQQRLQILDKDSRREKSAVVWTYTFTSYQLGKWVVPPIEIQIGPRSFSTEAIALDVSTLRKENDAEMREEFGQVSVPIHWSRWLLALLVVTCIVGAVKIFPRVLKRLPARELVSVIEAPLSTVQTDEEWLRARLTELRARLREEPENDHLVDELTQVLREYFSRRWEVPVTNWTTREFKTRLASDTSAMKVSPIFENCDEFKFRADKPMSHYEITSRSIQESEAILL